MSWQRRARLIIGLAAVVFAVVLAFAFRDRPQSEAPPPVVATDPEALVESAGGVTLRIDRDEEQMRVEYERLLTYAEGRNRMMNVKVTTERSEGRTFVVEADEGEAAADESSIKLVGDVTLTSSDGLRIEAETATYTSAEGIVRAPGPVVFSEGRTSGTSIGLDYHADSETLQLLEQVLVRVAGDEGVLTMEVAAGAAQFRRLEHVIAFDESVDGMRGDQRIAADEGVAYLGGDNEFLSRLELQGNSRITGVSPQPGGLEAMTGTAIDLDYRDEGQTLDRATIVENAEIRIAGNGAGQGRRISANRIEFVTTADGSMPRSLDARGQVRMQLPAAGQSASRTIQAQMFQGTGDDARGLTGGRFTGNVAFDEKSGARSRSAVSRTLDVVLAPGLGEVQEARFDGDVRFDNGAMNAIAARAVYRLRNDRLELRGGPDTAPPRLVDQRITVEATTIDVDFAGPQIAATGAVKSELRPDPAGGAEGTRRPSMLESDQPVLVVSDQLAYDGKMARAVYTGNARLSQADTSIKADSITLDEKSGDLSASGSVVTTTVLEQVTATMERQSVPSIARAGTFVYQEVDRRAIYEESAQVGGPQGDLQARRIELFLKESGNELERVEAFDNVTLVEQGRRTTGSRLTYFSED
ncbi:MAG: LPS export ABC transporter periplasmic protein LptC, partial [Vicinamibacterales bacterium]